MRGCFGGCTFCSITLHQGRPIQSRSSDSILRELKTIAQSPGFSGQISDIGGPTANMYGMQCSSPKAQASCRRPSCIYPSICKLLNTSHKSLIELMQAGRKIEGIRKINIASGIRMDLAQRDPEYLDEIIRYHVGGHLKVAPEHCSNRVLALMKKPDRKNFESFSRIFREISARAGKEQYLVPYFISSHPGSGIPEMIELALFLKKNDYRPLQVQDFIPGPMDVATCMYYSGLDPQTLRPVYSARSEVERRDQRVLLQYFKAENWKDVHRILIEAGRKDLIGSRPGCLIGAKPPPGAWKKKSDPRRPRNKRNRS